VFLEIARPISLLLCIFSTLVVFRSAFLGPAIEMQVRLIHSVELLTIAAGIAVVSGMLFRPDARDEEQGIHRQADVLMRTLPIRFFCWAVGIMTILFLMSWYLQSHPMDLRHARV
jgi:hypothetical protein